MEKIAFVYPNDNSGYMKSPETGCKRLSAIIKDSISVSDDDCSYEQLRNDGYRIFCYGHKPSLYVNRKISVASLDDIVNVRSRWASTAIGIRCISGFSYWKRHQNAYTCFFPTVTTFRRQFHPSDVCIGYYSRNIRTDTQREFIAFSNTVPLEVPVIVMGDDIHDMRKHEFTTDENVFFSKVTHYFYMRSCIHDDPWPHTLLQACQCGCSLIMPDIKRDWQDGVDDILSVCDVHPVDSLSVKFPWEKNAPCSYAPKGEDFLKLYEIIQESWNFLPDKKIFSFRDLYEFSLKMS